MGVLFSVNFLCSVSSNVFVRLLTYLIIAAIVVATYRLALWYRDEEQGGYISYGKAFSFIVLSFFFASLVSALVKFVYLQYINTDYLDNLFTQSMAVLEKLNMPTGQTEESLRSLLKPSTFVFQYIWANVLIGCFVGMVTAVFAKRTKNIFDE